MASGEIPIRCAYTELRDVAALVPHPRNPNKHPQAQIELFAKILKHQGVRRAVVVSKRSGFVVAGHGLIQAAQLAGIKRLPVDEQEFANEADEWAHLVADNRIAELAEMDNQALAGILRDLKPDLDLGLAGFDAEAIAALTPPAVINSDDEHAGALMDRAAELQKHWQTKRGQMWALGQHRLLCGDSTSGQDVATLMAGEKADLIFTDPPYNCVKNLSNISVRAPTQKKCLAVLKKAAWDKDFKPRASLDLLPLADHCTVYICTSHFLFAEILGWASERLDFSGFCAWCKPNPIPSLGKRHWTWAMELIIYGTVGRHVCNFPAEGHALNRWEITSHSHDTSHPTQKPVEVPGRAIQFSSKASQVVFDGFAGSGTTIIACEQLGRYCRAMEIDPGYVAVTLQRWADLTGRKPELIAP